LSMKAVIFSGVRGHPASVLSVAEIPKPIPQAGQALIRVRYTPIHPSVLAGVSPGVYPGPAKGEAPGNEGVGIVEAYGPDTPESVPLNSRVLVFGSAGTWSEYVLMSAPTLIPVPEKVADHNAAQFFVNPLTALIMTTQSLAPKPGEWILQTAAASVLGRLVIQLGKVYGFKTINVVRSPEQVKELLDLGADEVICTKTENLGERIRSITGSGVKYALDCVGGDGTSEILRAMHYGGKLVIFGQLAKEEVHFPSGLLIVKLLRIEGFWLADWMRTAPPEARKKGIQDLMQLFSTGQLDCPVDATFTLDQLQDAIKASLKQGKSGKTLLKLSEKSLL